MSLATRCPACATQFKVVRDQLRISDGWVRCGRCSEVFDASLDLRETPDATPSGAATELAAPPAVVPDQAAPQEHQSHDVMAPLTPAGQPTLMASSGLYIDLLAPLSKPGRETLPAHGDALKWPASDLLDWTPTARTAAPQRDVPAPAPASVPASDLPPYGLIADEPWPAATPAPPGPVALGAQVDAARLAQPLAPIASVAPPVEPDRIELTSASLDSPPTEAAGVDLQWQKALRRARAKAGKIARSREKKVAVAIARAGGPTAPAPPEAAPSDLPSFLEDDASAVGTRPQRALRPRTLRWIAVLAAVLLIVQVMRQERDVLAARQPGLQPVLSLLCSLTGCEVAALRQIGSITIDGAAFARDKDANNYRLSFALRNSAAVPLAMPAVELTLLDTQERAVVRRVILPAEFGAPSVLAANGERMASLALSLNGTEAAALPPVAGYRVLAFYP